MRNADGQTRQVLRFQSDVHLMWGSIVVRILGIKESPSSEVIVLGVTFKNMKLKPQVLDKYLNKGGIEKELQSNKNRVREDDVLYLEDEGTRTQLTGVALSISQYVSGHNTPFPKCSDQFLVRRDVFGCQGSAASGWKV